MNYYRANLPEESDAKPGSLVPTAQSVPAARDPYNSAVGAYGAAAAETPSDFQLDLLEYLRILIKRRWIILSIIAASLTLGAVMTSDEDATLYVDGSDSRSIETSPRLSRAATSRHEGVRF